MRKGISIIHAGLLLLFGFVFDLHGQERRVMERLESGMVFDGMPDEAAWESLAPFPLITHLPVFGRPPSEKSVVKMGYDDQYLYVGALLYVSHSEYVRAIGKKRDMNSMSCDWFGVSMDTYNDNENALLFFTNPLGLRWDASVKNDAMPTMDQMPMNMDWNTFWEVKTRYDEKGWYLEMMIPISSLRFQELDGITVMGISFFRWIPAKDEGDVFPAISTEWGPTSNLKPSLFEEVEFHGLHPKKPLHISPYVLTAFEQEHELNAHETAYDYSQKYKVEPGLDVKYGINSNTVLDLTVNTDFAQVEADDQQFNLSRFSLFFKEKRKFFLERSSIFDFALGGMSNMFYSRRIGLYEGEPVRIWGGARLNSRINDWDIGLLNLQTASCEDLPSENFGAFRVKRRVFNPYSYVGGLVTTRLGVNGTYNIAYGIDGVFRVIGDEYLTIRLAQVAQDSVDFNPNSLNPSRVMLNWERRKQEGWSYSAGFSYSGTTFDPGIGFEMLEDFIATAPRLQYTWISPDVSWLQSHYIQLFNYTFFQVPGNELMIMGLNPNWFFSSKNNWMGSIGPVYRIDRLDEEFEITDEVSVPVGRYDYLGLEMMLQTQGTRAFFTTFQFEGGGYFDASRLPPSLDPQWNLGASIELGGLYRFDHITFPDRNQTLNNHIAGLRALYMFSTQLSLSAFIQYNTAIHKVISNVRFRYNPREGTDLYVVFNEGRNTWLEREVPHLPAFDQRNVTIKFTYTFDFQR